MKTLAEFAKNPDWLKMLRLYADSFIKDGVSPNEKVIVTHHWSNDPNHDKAPKAVYHESSPLFKPYKGMTRTNLIELPEGMTLGKLSSYTPDSGVTMEPIPADKKTLDQAAAIMLLHGTEAQKAQALQYINIPSNRVEDVFKLIGLITGVDEPSQVERRDFNKAVPRERYDWVMRFINDERYRSTQVSTDGSVIELLERLENVYEQYITLQRKTA